MPSRPPKRMTWFERKLAAWVERQLAIYRAIFEEPGPDTHPSDEAPDGKATGPGPDDRR